MQLGTEIENATLDILREPKCYHQVYTLVIIIFHPVTATDPHV